MAESQISVMGKEFTEEFSRLLSLKHKAPNDHLALLMDCLRRHKLVYRAERVNPNLFLAHKNNRGGLLLSPHSVHRNAAKISAAGANMKNLSNAVAMELASQGALRAEHIKKNEELIKRAGGLLASINGFERYVSLGCGHTVAFCKTAQVHGETSAHELQAHGSAKIDVQRVCASADFNTMFHSGWDWDVVPACVDEAFDEFSKIAQKALNTQNHANTPISELEVMMTIATSLNDPGFKDVKNHKELAVDISAPCVRLPAHMPARCSTLSALTVEAMKHHTSGSWTM